VSSLADFRGESAERREGRSLAWRLRQPVVPAAKWALRRYGMATAGTRVLPDFLVVGAKRGGSTSLYKNLARTPGVLPLFPVREQVKGTYYFDVEFGRGERWYRSHFPTAAERVAGTVAGEASPYYLSHPWAAARAAELVPEARIVALLRDPVERAHSHYKERVKQGIETLPTFEAAIEAEDGRLAGEVERMRADPGYVSWNHLNFGYLAQSDYATGLRRWLDAFPTEQVLVLASEEFYAAEGETIDRVRAHLGLPPVGLGRAEHFNDTGSSSVAPALEHDLRARLAPGIAELATLTGLQAPWMPSTTGLAV
jgi:hypothetical protein